MRRAVFLPLALLAAPAAAQSGGLLSQLGGGQAGGGGLLGALGGAGGLGGAIGGAGIGNVTGLLGYCVRNQLLGSAGLGAGANGTAGSLLGRLSGRPGVAQSPGFLAGQQGVVQSGGNSLPLGSLGTGVKQQLCRTVLGRAQGLLGR